MERWHNTIDTHEAAAFAALGATVRIQSTMHQRTSTRTVRFLISPTTEDGKWNVGKIRHGVKHKTLPRTDPGHPYLVFLRAFMNRASLLDIVKKGTFMRLVQVAGAAGVWQYIPGDTGLPGIDGAAAIVRTEDLKMAAALVTAGFPVLRITGAGGTHEFTHAAFGPAGLNAAHYLSEWRRDAQALPWELPFTKAAHALTIRERLTVEVRKSIDNVILSKPRTTSHAVIRTDAAPEAWDKAARFFTGIR